MKNLFLLTIFALPGLILPTTPSFVIKPKKAPIDQAASRDELKEQLGDATKMLFKQMTATIDRMGDALLDVSKKPTAQQFGTLNKQIAATQRISSTLIEKLVDDHKIYKKVTKPQLKQLITQLDATKGVLVSAQAAVGTADFAHKVSGVMRAVTALQNDPAVKLICQ